MVTQRTSLGLGSIVQTTSTLDLGVIDTGTPPLTVQWQKDGMNIGAPVVPDADNIAHHYILNAQVSDMGRYTAVSTNSIGSATSTPYPIHRR